MSAYLKELGLFGIASWMRHQAKEEVEHGLKIFDYIMTCFEALHTTGTNYIIEDIDLYIEARQAVV